METLLFFIIKYMYGLKLPGVAGAFPEVITIHQRRRTPITLIFKIFFCQTLIFLPCNLLCIFHRGVQRLGHFQMPSTEEAEFPYNAAFAGHRKCSNCVTVWLS